jgi:glutathione S-transferase
MKLELFHNNMSVCAQKVRLVMAEKGLEPELHHLNIRAGEQLTPEYLSMNPAGVVPTLLVDGSPIVESTLISEYLDEQFPEPALRPVDPRARADMRRWAMMPDVGLHAACGAISFAIAFREQLLALGDEAVARNIEETPDPARRERKRQTLKFGVDAPVVEGAVSLYDKVFSEMERRLQAGQDWIMGDQYTLADTALTPYAVRVDQLALTPLFEKRPGLTAWLGRVRQRANFSGIADFLDESYLTLMSRTGPSACPRIAQILAR